MSARVGFSLKLKGFGGDLLPSGGAVRCTSRRNTCQGARQLAQIKHFLDGFIDSLNKGDTACRATGDFTALFMLNSLHYCCK